MTRFTGTVAHLALCPGALALAAWVEAIAWTDWPQQNRLADGKIRPAMVTDLAWYGFGAVTENLVQGLAARAGGIPSRRMLSVVMPGADIAPHTDGQGKDWIVRVHVPILTNPDAWFFCEDLRFHLEAGNAYLVNTQRRHEVRNNGVTPRIHLMFDVSKR